MTIADFHPRWGAHPLTDGERWRFRLWSPSAEGVSLSLEGRDLQMSPDGDGWFSCEAEAAAGQSYMFVRDGERRPDPAARAQSGDVHGPSVLVETASLPRRASWRGRDWREAVLYELHVGTFTREGTLRAAAARLGDLAHMGITAVSLMPLNQFAGSRGWGYDGVLPYAVHPAYGTPQDMAAFVAAAQGHGLMVLVDVVYNHFGPEGCPLTHLAPDFFDADRQTPWGAGIDFTREPVRRFFHENAAMWLRDYGCDGLRIDAAHHLGAHDDTAFLTGLAEHVHGLDLGRPLHLVAEDERNLAGYVGTDGKLTAQWNDDYHHCVHVLLTGESHSYYKPFAADPMGDLVTAMRDGQVDQGQPRPYGAEPRGEPSAHLPPWVFVNANQTHDQIGNRAKGERLITLADPGAVRAVHALLLLAPYVPMLFMGEEAGARAPFLFFTDYEGDLAQAVREGRRSEFPEFSNAAEIPDPNDRHTFHASRPFDALPDDADDWRGLTRHLLGLRHDHVVPLLKSGARETIAERLADRSFRAAWRFGDGDLEICFTLEGVPASLSRGMEEIYHITHESGAGLRAGRGDLP